MSKSFYRAFEDRYRGSRQLIKGRQRIYLPFIQPLRVLYPESFLLDLGCGRGEWLELLLENGFQAKGVDIDEGMLEGCIALSLPVEQGEALATLKSMANESLSVVSGFHLAEHILFSDLQQLVVEALRVLKPAGLLILETPNSENILVGTEYFYLDPTHQRPLPQLLLTFLAEFCGFSRTKILRLQESPALMQAKEVGLISVLGGASPDYALLAQKAAAPEEMASFDALFSHEYGLPLEVLATRYQQNIDAKFEQVNERLGIVRAEMNKTILAIKSEELARETEALHAALVHQGLLEARLAAIVVINERLSGQLQAALDASKYQERCADYWHTRVLSLHGSTSWRITRPLRAFKKMAMGDFFPIHRAVQKVIKVSLRPLAVTLTQVILRRPKLQAWAKKILRNQPSIQRHLVLFAYNSGLTASAQELSPSGEHTQSKKFTDLASTKIMAFAATTLVADDGKSEVVFI